MQELRHPSIAAARIHSRDKERGPDGRFLCKLCDERIEHGTHGGYLNWRCRCDPCNKATLDYRQEYQRSPKRRAYNAKVMRDRWQWYVQQKIGHQCADCGLACTKENYPAFDWDHKPGSEKAMNLAAMVGRCSNREKLLAEIAKCELRCANCHRIMTFRRRRLSIA